MSSSDLGFPPLGSAAFVPVSWFKSAKSAAKIAREVAARYDTTRNTDRINVRTVETSAHLVPFRFGRSDAHGRFRDLEERIQSCQSLANVQLRPAIHSLLEGPFYIGVGISHMCLRDLAVADMLRPCWACSENWKMRPVFICCTFLFHNVHDRARCDRLICVLRVSDNDRIRFWPLEYNSQRDGLCVLTTLHLVLFALTASPMNTTW